ncbi:RNA-binding cell elongation regulator Jag/EloR [Salinicoccus carnicancri]|uniref:RNA-binding cell elongation regulator Jag/EloR n=1 Tax=Salinicoccus carnicancri TaxID=558170 RepID=UPI0002F92CE3|nr:RNA-binding cell elongation regulator Jag/EloR [Salinicoccus carnicancri]
MYRIYREETVDRAIARGLEELKVTESDIRIDVEDEGKRGIFGFGKKEAAVRLTVINPELKAHGTIEALISRDVDKVDSVTAEAPAEKGAAPEDTTGPPMEKNGTTTVEPSGEGTVDDSDTGAPARDNKVLMREAAERTKCYIDDIIRDMNIEGTSRTDINGNEIRIDIESPAAAKLIGKRGATLNALQEIAQNYFNSIHRSYGIIILDVGDYREKRRETLENLAMNMSKKALRSNGPLRMEPMPSFERKIMHHVLSDIENIETYSEGSEPNRYLVIEKK